LYTYIFIDPSTYIYSTFCKYPRCCAMYRESIADGDNEDHEKLYEMINAVAIDKEILQAYALSESALDLLLKLLQADPVKRLCTTEALHHEWIATKRGASAAPSTLPSRSTSANYSDVTAATASAEESAPALLKFKMKADPYKGLTTAESLRRSSSPSPDGLLSSLTSMLGLSVRGLDANNPTIPRRSSKVLILEEDDDS
jgi:serine/threonine protein kinase